MKALAEEIALFDMDGTLCDHDHAIRRDMHAIKHPDEVLPKNFFATSEPYLRKRIDFIRQRPGWWQSLKPLKIGFDILNLTKKAGFQTYILTKGPASAPKAWEEKVTWIQKHVPDAKITITEDKGLVYGRILVDDYPLYIKRWLENRPRGLVIMPAHEYNKDFAHPNVIRYDGSNKKEVAEAIKRVRLRAPKKNFF